MTRWLPGVGRGNAPVRLFAFPHAGGGSRFFLPWHAALGPRVQVCPVVLPGRESRTREEPYTRIGPLVRDLADALGPHLDRPFAFFGHSLGALVAFETVKALVAAGLPEPGLLIASGRRAPHLTPRSTALHLLPHEQFLTHMISLNGTTVHTDRRRRLLEHFVPVVRADYELNETYQPGPAARPACAVVAYHGREDPVATPEQVRAWRDATTGPFRLRLFAGDHFYHRDAPAELAAAIHTDLAEAGLTSRRSDGTPPVHVGVGHGGPSGQNR